VRARHRPKRCWVGSNRGPCKRVAAALGFSAAELAELAIEGIASTFLDPVDRARLEAEFRDRLHLTGYQT